jgi:predicted NUDIX family phosphoesterase/thymidylate kinase
MSRSWLHPIGIPEGSVTHPSDDEEEAGIADIEEFAQRILGPLPARQATARLSRRPFFVEFAGAPKAGKTTALDLIDRMLRRIGYRVRVVTERASTSPLRNKHDPLFNLWTASTTLAQIIESQDRDDHIVLIDRGIFDALCWMDWFRSTRSLTQDGYERIAGFLGMPLIRRLTDLVFVMTVAPEEALDRELAAELTSRHGAIMNRSTLGSLDTSIRYTLSQHGTDFRHVHVDTTGTDQITIVKRMARLTLTALDQFLNSILVVPRTAVDYLPSAGFVSDDATIERFLTDIDRYGEYVIRDEAEVRSDYVQPIPIAYLLHRDRVVVFHRSDRNMSHRLHGQYMIWAGGHVRRDDVGEDPIGDALAREMQEELGLPTGLEAEVVGMVCDSTDERSRRHVGVVHRVRVDEPSLAVAMERGRFVERHSSSMISRLVGPDDIAALWARMEEWSRLIISEHLGWPPPQSPGAVGGPA